MLAIKKEQQSLYKLENPEQKPLLSKSQSVNCFQKSDMCTRAMFKPYKAIAKQNWINKLKKGEWREGEDPSFQGHTSSVKDVSQEFTKYYKMLLSEKKVCKKELKKAIKLVGKKKILNQSRDDLEKEFTLKEVVAVMESLPLGKAPGPNGMPNAVYKCLSKHFAPKFTQFINALRDNENAPKHMLQGKICQLYKKKRTRRPTQLSAYHITKHRLQNVHPHPVKKNETSSSRVYLYISKRLHATRAHPGLLNAVTPHGSVHQ